MMLQLFLCKERAASRTVLVASTCPMNGMVGPSRLKACHTKRGGRDLWSCQVKAILGSLMKLVQKLKRNDADDDEEDKDDTNNTSNKQHSKMSSDHWQQREREQWEQQGKRSRSRSRNDK